MSPATRRGTWRGAPLVARVEQHVVVERLDLLGRRRRTVDRARRDGTEPPVDAEALREGLEPRVPRVGGAARADRQRRARARGAVHDRDRDGDVEEHAAADHGVPQTRGIEEPVGQRAGDRIRLPRDPREGERRVPREHHRVPLHELEQRGERRLPGRRRTGEPAARRVRDRRAGRRRRPRKTSAAGANAGAPSASETPSTKSSSVSSVNDAKGKDGCPRLRCMEEREVRRRHGPAAERPGRNPDQPRRREVRRGVALDRFAQRSGTSPRVALGGPAPVVDRRAAERAPRGREPAGVVRDRRVVGAVHRPDDVGDDARHRRARSFKPCGAPRRAA